MLRQKEFWISILALCQELTKAANKRFKLRSEEAEPLKLFQVINEYITSNKPKVEPFLPNVPKCRFPNGTDHICIVAIDEYQVCYQVVFSLKLDVLVLSCLVCNISSQELNHCDLGFGTSTTDPERSPTYFVYDSFASLSEAALPFVILVCLKEKKEGSYLVI